MSDYSDILKNPPPNLLFRKPGALEFADQHGRVYATGAQAPEGYHWVALRQPLNASQVEVYMLNGEKE